MSDPLRFLVIDGYLRAAREELAAGGAGVAADLYTRMLLRCAPAGATCDVLFPSDPGAVLPTVTALRDFDGIAWTGCSLCINDDLPAVAAQIELARAAFRERVPSFGSCWAAQIAVVATGGTVAPNPRGREMGIARKIALTPEGRRHPLYEGKVSVFDGFTSHDDEITELSDSSRRLAGNAFTSVQSVAVESEGGSFWGLQYHPEYDLHELARLTACRLDKLIERGFFATPEDVAAYVDRLEMLHLDPSRKDIAWQLGIDDDLMDAEFRQLEVRNWIEKLVIPAKRS